MTVSALNDIESRPEESSCLRLIARGRSRVLANGSGTGFSETGARYVRLSSQLDDHRLGLLSFDGFEESDG